MGVDLRQVVAGILTITMFVMLGDMFKRDYVDTPQERFLSGGEGRDVEFDSGRVMEKFSMKSNGPWMEESQELRACWTKKSEYDEMEDIKGFVTFSLTNGPEYHVSQISDAVTIARYLKATLVVPDIRGDRPGDERKFEEIYDVRKFVNSLDGVVKVARELPESISIRDFEVVRVPNRVTEEHIAENIEPVFKRKGNIRVATYFPAVNMRKTIQKSGSSDSLACLAMFDTLELKPEVNEVVDDMVARLKTLSRKSDGRFVAVDLRVDMLEKKGCQGGGSSATKNCYNGHEIALFLRKIGFGQETVIYLTQSRWDESLEVLKDIFPKTYTKESVMSAEKKPKFLEAEDSELEKVMDFYLCTRSDVFVPAISGLFYANVAGKRIAAGKTQILVPAEIPGTSLAVTSHFSPYISKRNHMAYTCFC